MHAAPPPYPFRDGMRGNGKKMRKKRSCARKGASQRNTAWFRAVWAIGADDFVFQQLIS